MADKIYAECVNDSNGGEGTNSSLGTSIGIAPKSCINFTCNYDTANNNLEFTWEDIDCDFWGGVRFILKKGSEPETFTDGDIILDITEINKYKTEPLKIPVSETGNYYAILFPFSSTWVMNTIRNNMLNKPIVIAKPFADSTWEEISAISETGLASNAYNIDDSKPITVGSYIYNMKIVGFDMFNLSSDPTKTAGICLFADKAYPVSTYRNDLTVSGNIQGIIKAYTDLMFNLMPSDVSNYIKEVQMSWVYNSTQDITNTKMACLPFSYMQENGFYKLKRRTADDNVWADYIGCGPYNISNNTYFKFSGISGDVKQNTISIGSSATYPVFCFNI